MTLAVVDGLEFFGAQRKIAIGCDTCPNQFGGGYSWSQEDQLRRDARKAGWTGPMERNSTGDRCPECSKNRKVE